MSAPVQTTVPASGIEEPPRSRTGIRLLYVVFILLSLLAAGSVVAIIIVARQLYFSNGLVTG